MEPSPGLTRGQVNKVGNFIRRSLTKWLDNDNIVSVGIAKKMIEGLVLNESSVCFSVIEKKDIEDLSPDEVIPDSFSFGNFTLRTDVVEGRLPTTSRASQVAVANDNPRTQLRNPIQPGISIGSLGTNMNTGTIGSIVYKNNVPHLISNFHVLGERATRVIQPGGLDSLRNSYHEIGSVVRADKDLDCSLSTIAYRGIDRKVYGFEQDVIACDIGDVSIGDEVVKSGRRTKITYGVVMCIKAIVKKRGGGKLINQFLIGVHPDFIPPFCEISSEYDSGSGWIKVKDGRPTGTILGINTGGDPSDVDSDCSKEFAVATEMKAIAKKFKITIKPS